MAGHRVRRRPLRSGHPGLQQHRAVAHSAGNRRRTGPRMRMDFEQIDAPSLCRGWHLPRRSRSLSSSPSAVGCFPAQLGGAARRRSWLRRSWRDGDRCGSGRASAGSRPPPVFQSGHPECRGRAWRLIRSADDPRAHGRSPQHGMGRHSRSREYNPATDNAAGRIVSPGYFRTMGIG